MNLEDMDYSPWFNETKYDQIIEPEEMKLALLYEFLRRNPVILKKRFSRLVADHPISSPSINEDRFPHDDWQSWVKQAYPYIEHPWVMLKSLPIGEENNITSVHEHLSKFNSSRWLTYPENVSHPSRIFNEKGERIRVNGNDTCAYINSQQAWDDENIKNCEKHGYKLFAIKIDNTTDFGTATKWIKDNFIKPKASGKTKGSGPQYKSTIWCKHLTEWNDYLCSIPFENNIKEILTILECYWYENDLDQYCLPPKIAKAQVANKE